MAAYWLLDFWPYNVYKLRLYGSLFLFLISEVHPPTTTTESSTSTRIIPPQTTRKPRRKGSRNRNRKRQREQLHRMQNRETTSFSPILTEEEKVIEEVNHISFIINEEKGEFGKYICWLYISRVSRKLD